MDDTDFMDIALEEARRTLQRGEFPVGCVLVHDGPDGGRVLATGARSGTAGGGINEVDHAEMAALRSLSTLVPPVPPREITAYCTMEPCLMCFAALMLTGVGRVVYAYEDAMGGGTRCDFDGLPPLYAGRGIKVAGGVRRRESLALFKAYFSDPAQGYWKGSLLARYTLDQPEEDGA